jgi:hypothetical protein
MSNTPPSDPADHAAEFSRTWVDRLDQYCAIRMDELGIPADKIGEENPGGPGTWRAFVPEERTGVFTSRGVIVNSGCLNPELLKGEKGGRIWPRAKLKDRIDAIIAHEWEEDQTLDHKEALKAAAKTELPVSEGARRILRAMSR